jgi:hypothetical protein
MLNEWMIGYMTIDLSDDELQEIAKAREAVRRLHEARELPVYNLTKLINQFRLHLPWNLVTKPETTLSSVAVR